MPRYIESPRPKASSDSLSSLQASSAPSAARNGQFTEFQQPSRPAGSAGGEGKPNGSPPGEPEQNEIGGNKIDEEATEPFPPGIFRVPVPNRLFSEMPRMSDVALRCLLAMIHRSWHFAPEEEAWIHRGETFGRAEIQGDAGLSDQGARNGLSELEEAGWTEVDRSGKAHRHRLTVGVPSRRYTYLPTHLLRETERLPSGTALRALLAIFRATWGWTQELHPSSDKNRSGPAHRRWARLSRTDLARRTGRSENAVRTALSALEGEWVGTARPGRGACAYRVIGSAFAPQPSGENQDPSPKTPEAEDRKSLSKSSSGAPAWGLIANGLIPDRQQIEPPTSIKENFKESKQTRGASSDLPDQIPTEAPPEKGGEEGAVRKKNSSSENNSSEVGEKLPQRQQPTSNAEEVREESQSFSEFSQRKRELAQKLMNVGVWPRRVRECLRRYSADRIEANFELYRERAPEIEDDGAWLCAAITDGYAIGRHRQETSGNRENGAPEGSEEGGGGSSSQTHGSVPTLPSHKEKISARRKQMLIRRHPGAKGDHFHRFRHAESPDKKQFLYFDPSIGGPNSRTIRNRRASEKRLVR